MNTNRRIIVYPLIAMSAVFLLALVVLEFILRSWFYQRSQVELSRVAEATLQSIEQINASADEMDLIADSIGQVSTNYRITITDIDGYILGDSRYSESQIKAFGSLAGREEFQQAMKHGYSFIVRDTSSGSIQMMFLAAKFSAQDMQGILRISADFSDLRSAILQLRFTLAAIGFLGLILLSALIFVFTRKLNNSIVKAQEMLETRVQERTQEIEILQRFASMLAACNTNEEVQKVVDNILPRIIGNDNGAICLFDNNRKLLEMKLQWPNQWRGEHHYESDDCWALRKGKYHISKDEYSEVKCNHMKQVNGVTLCIPLIAQGNSIGIMHLMINREIDVHFKKIAFTIAEHLGLTLANIKLQEKLREQAIRDPLTHLYNRRYLDEVLTTEINRSRRHKEHFALLLLDIDHFKRFNDKYGHDAGDFVLTELSVILRTCVRTEDTVARVGGEELAILAPRVGKPEAVKLANKICQLIRTHNLNHNGNDLGQVTISIGVSIFDEHIQNAEVLMKTADMALYQSKENGRDQYTIASHTTKQEPPEQPQRPKAVVEPLNKKSTNSP